MALYYYKGVKGGGKKASGFVPAHTDKEAERNVERLAIRNYTIKRIASSRNKKKSRLQVLLGGIWRF